MPWPKSPLAEVACLAVGMAVLQPVAALGAATHIVLAVAFAAISGYAIPIVLATWTAADLRARGRTPSFELPFLLLLAWPVSLLCYCIWTRGWHGLLLAIGLIVLSYLPTFTTLVAVGLVSLA